MDLEDYKNMGVEASHFLAPMVTEKTSCRPKIRSELYGKRRFICIAFINGITYQFIGEGTPPDKKKAKEN